MTPEENISKLLRLKRYEQPPPGYFDGFLREFQSRQRSDLLRLSLWEIVWDRISTIAPSFQVPRFAYASVAALALAASVFIIARPATKAPGNLAESRQSLTLTSPQPVMIGASLPVVMTSTGSPSVHYVLPTSPVSYASSRSF
ncbi:MAG: hypothetical protein WCQ16_11150 [Verrucomicrobiae bacterium]